jgi:FdhE protein
VARPRTYAGRAAWTRGNPAPGRCFVGERTGDTERRSIRLRATHVRQRNVRRRTATAVRAAQATPLSVPSLLDPVLTARPELVAAASVLRALIGAARSLPAELPDGVPNIDAAATRMDEGVAALAGEPLVSAALFVRNMREIAASLEHVADAASTAGSVRLMLDRHATELVADDGEGVTLANAALERDTEILAAIARRLRVDELAFVTIADHAARSALRAGAQRVRALVAQREWNHGTCPACAAPPLLAELRSDGERWLRCARCASAWSFPRVGCPGCGTRDHRMLGYLHLDGERDHRRADRCDACRRYVKAVAVLGPLNWEELLEADLATVDLDLIAAERDYRRD